MSGDQDVIAYGSDTARVVAFQGRKDIVARICGWNRGDWHDFRVRIVQGDREPWAAGNITINVGVDWLLANMPEHVDTAKLYCHLADSHYKFAYTVLTNANRTVTNNVLTKGSDGWTD